MAASAGTKPDRADVVIVGAGVGGALASLVLARAGLRVVCLEQGGGRGPRTTPTSRPTGNGSARRAGAPRRTCGAFLRITRSTQRRTDPDVERRRRVDDRLHRHLAAVPPLRFPQGDRARAPARLAVHLRGPRALGTSGTTATRGVSGLLGDPSHAAARAFPDPAAGAGHAWPCRLARGFESWAGTGGRCRAPSSRRTTTAGWPATTVVTASLVAPAARSMTSR